jgi:hypothetical protein
MSSKYDVSSRTAKITQKSTTIEYTESKIPEPSLNFFSLFKTASGTSSGLSNLHIVDVLPNFLPIISYCMYHATLFYPLMESRNHAKLSVPTLTAYFMSLIYAHFLASDCFLRPSSSFYADKFLENNKQKEFLNFLLSLPLPDFLTPILDQFTISSSPRRNNVVFCPSAAGYSYHHHFGRIFPINFLTVIHDVAAETSSRTDINLVLAEYLDTTLVHISNETDASTPVPFDLRPSNLLATSFKASSTSAATRLNNKFNQMFTSIFNPVLLRALQQKVSLAPVNLSAPTFATATHSPYEFMFSLTKNNIPELRVLLESVAANFKGVISCKSDLAAHYSNLSGTTIFNHGYSTFALPTFHHQTNATPTTSRMKPIAPSDFAAALNFLQTLTVTASSAAALKRPTCTKSSSDNVDYTHSLLLISDTDFPSDQDDIIPALSDVHQYDDDYDLYPTVSVFNPFEDSSVDAYLTTLSGKVIESFELAASVVLHPNTDNQIGIENSTFLTSAVQLKFSIRATSFSGRSSLSILDRPRIEQQRPAAVSLFYDPSRLLLPYFTPTISLPLISGLPFGFTPLNSVSWSSKVQSFLGFKVNASLSGLPSSEKEQEPAHTPEHHTIVWSPYTYVSPSLEDTDNTKTLESRVYFITNLRTIFGHDVTMTEVNGALDAMPAI